MFVVCLMMALFWAVMVVGIARFAGMWRCVVSVMFRAGAAGGQPPGLSVSPSDARGEHDPSAELGAAAWIARSEASDVADFD
jgi:hypothetical protein